jgi:hypothetical protein
MNHTPPTAETFARYALAPYMFCGVRVSEYLAKVVEALGDHGRADLADLAWLSLVLDYGDSYRDDLKRRWPDLYPRLHRLMFHDQDYVAPRLQGDPDLQAVSAARHLVELKMLRSLAENGSPHWSWMLQRKQARRTKILETLPEAPATLLQAIREL